VVLPTLIAMAGPAFVRRHYSLERLADNNEVAGFKFATVGVIYAVMLGFAVVVVWEKFHDAEAAVMQEAGAATTLYRLADGLAADIAPRFREGLTQYLHAAIAEDWPAMEDGKASPAVTRTLTAIYDDVLREKPGDSPSPVVSEVLAQLDALTAARRARLQLASGAAPGAIWFVLFVGGVVTIGFTFFLASRNLRAQILMVGMLSVLVFIALLVIITIDHPFTGPVHVDSEPLELVLHEFAPHG
jgi:hypothetical protein